jgi:nicotinate-nucleotide pyrophosphorylase (carboxylating)
MHTKKPYYHLNKRDQTLIDLAFFEDLGQPYRDVTTELLFNNENHHSTAKIISKHPTPIVIAGLQFLPTIFSKMAIEWHSDYHDGMLLETQRTLLTLKGPSKNLLMCERITLNFLQRLCAIATTTQQFVKKIQHTRTKILDTRKTIPGWRNLEKYAVACGGGVNHRFGLYDAMMIKDTHSDFLGGIEKALNALPENILEKFPVIIEVQNPEELCIALKSSHKISRILLDNMSTATIKTCVDFCRNKISTEASGNVHLENVREIAETGVDFISIGKITHSAGNVDLSMKCELNP